MAALRLREKIRDSALAMGDIAGIALSGSGAAVVAFTGKLMLAVVLVAVALGFFLRLSGRRKSAEPRPLPLPLWVRPAAGLLACVEAAVLTEATSLPVRFYQPGFAMWHWLLMAAAIAIAYGLHMRLFVAWLRKTGADKASSALIERT